MAWFKRKDRQNNTKRKRVWVPVRQMDLDGFGLPSGFSAVLVVDEFGNAGRYPKDHETVFGYCVSEVKRPDTFASLTEINRVMEEKEVKASKDHRNPEICRDMRMIGVTPEAVYVDKYRPPTGWMDPERDAVQRGVLRVALDRAVPDIDGNLFVILDHHTAYTPQTPVRIRERYSDRRIVDGDEYDSRSGQFSDLLQTHDNAVFATHKFVEDGIVNRIRYLRPKIHRITEDDHLEKW